MKRKLIRLAIGVFLLLAVGFAALFGFALYEKWGNPWLPKSSWPTLEAAATDNSQNVRVVVADDVQVSHFEDGIEYWECDLAADPQDANRLFTVSMVHVPDSIPYRLANVAGFYSHDGGKLWTRAFYLVADTGNTNSSQRASYFDPTVCYGREGTVQFAVMFGKGWIDHFVPKKAGDKPTREHHRVDFWRSDDAGVSWRARSSIPYYIDRPFTVVDTTSSPRSGRQYTIGQASSEVFVFANQEDDSEIGQGKVIDVEITNPRPANPVILSNGTALFAVEDFAPKWLGHVRPGTARQIVTFRCEDGENIIPGPKVNTQWSHESLDNGARPGFTMFPRLGANPYSNQFVDHVYCVWAGNRTTSIQSNRPDDV